MQRQQDEDSFACTVNGTQTMLAGDPVSPVTAALRARGLYSVRETCALGVCGSCTVLLDGEPVSACLLPLFAVEGRSILTAEGLEQHGRLSELQQQFIDSQAFQCSFCTPGFLLSGQALLERAGDTLRDTDIVEGLQGHLCRCGCYVGITEAIRAVAESSGKRVMPE